MVSKRQISGSNMLDHEHHWSNWEIYREWQDMNYGLPTDRYGGTNMRRCIIEGCNAVEWEDWNTDLFESYD